MFERPDSGDRALLVHVDLRHGAVDADVQTDRAEFTELARSAGLEVVGLVTAKRQRPTARHFVGTGKLEELRTQLAGFAEAGEPPVDVVLFGQRLTPSQERNLEAELKVRVLDRNSLILDIFAQRARTFEGKLQVELAQLDHLSTRLVRGWTHLERQKGGIGLRGPGETQLETDRRLLNERVRVLKRRLDKVRRQREQGRSQRSRSGIPTVALVGYTNAGKSTLFNRLTAADAYAADQLFATLDPTLRRMVLPGGTPVVLADTVGFIRDLPHELVEAFRSTLTETREADLLLHVVDDADEERERHREDVDKVLAGVGADEVPQLSVLNKIDVSGHSAGIERSEQGRPVAARVSALTGDGIQALLAAMAELLQGRRATGWLHVPASGGRLRARLFEAHAVQQEQVTDGGGFLLRLDMDAADFDRIAREHRISDELAPEPGLANESGHGSGNESGHGSGHEARLPAGHD